MSFGFSPSDIYLLLQLLGTVKESFGTGPQGAVSQYATFQAEFGLISQQLSELPEKSPEFQKLWDTTKAQCTNFVLKYGKLAPRDPRTLGNEETARQWLYSGGWRIFAKVKWPWTAQQEILTLERNVMRLLQMATHSLVAANQIENQQNYQRLELLVGQVLESITDSSSVFSRTNNEKLYLRIEEIRVQIMYIMYRRDLEGVSYTFDITSLIHRLPNTNLGPWDYNFDEAYDELGMIVETLQNLKMRQHHGSSLPSASSTIALMEHVTLIIRAAMSRIGFRLAQEHNNSPKYMAGQINLEDTLRAVYNDWVQFIKEVKNLCERSRAVSAPRTHDHPYDLAIIHEGSLRSELSILVEEPRGLNIDTRHRQVIRRDSGETSPGTRPSLSSRTGSFAPSVIANSTIGKPVKLIISRDESLNPTKHGKSLEECIISDIQFAIEQNTTFVELQSRDKKVISRHYIGRNTASSAKKGGIGQASIVKYSNSYENFRVVHGNQEPHYCGDPVYVFDNANDSYAFQSVVLHEEISGWKVVFSAVVQYVHHYERNTKENPAYLQILRVIRDYRGYNSIMYWEACLSDGTGGMEDFVKWSQLDFDGVTRFKENHARLSFTDDTKESKLRRKSSTSKSVSSMSSIFGSLRRLSKDTEHSPVPLSPRIDAFSTYSSSPIDMVSNSGVSNGESSSLSNSVPSEFDSPPLLAFEAKSKAKKEMKGLDVKFYSREGKRPSSSNNESHDPPESWLTS